MRFIYPQLVPVLIEAVKEQQATIGTQQGQIDALKAENAEVKARVDALEAKGAPRSG